MEKKEDRGGGGELWGPDVSGCFAVSITCMFQIYPEMTASVAPAFIFIYESEMSS
jgi:hypothetical protein